MKKEIKKVKKKETQEIFTGKDLAQHIGALSENFQHGLSAVIEEVSGLRKVFESEVKDIKAKQDMQTEMIGGMAIDIETLKDEMKEVKGEIVEIKGDIVGTKEDIVGIKGDIRELKVDMKEVKTDIVELKTDMKEVKNILKDKADTEKVVSFDSRLSRVEKMQKA
jgi:uncharacterized coiled-coil DUF342 family protein